MEDNDTNRSTKDSIAESWNEVLDSCGIRQGCVAPEDEPAEVLGRKLWDYMTASVYDMDWEGYPDSDLEGVRAFMADFAVALKAGL